MQASRSARCDMLCRRSNSSGAPSSSWSTTRSVLLPRGMLLMVLGQKIPEEELETVSGRMKTFHLTWRGAITGRIVQFPIEQLNPLTVQVIVCVETPLTRFVCKVGRLALAGLYYLPDAKIEDRTVCFKCGRAMFAWQQNDDPLYEHVKFNPSCEYVQDDDGNDGDGDGDGDDGNGDEKDSSEKDGSDDDDDDDDDDDEKGDADCDLDYEFETKTIKDPCMIVHITAISVGDDNFKFDKTDMTTPIGEEGNTESFVESEAVEEKIDWNSITEDLPRDAVIDGDNDHYDGEGDGGDGDDDENDEIGIGGGRRLIAGHVDMSVCRSSHCCSPRYRHQRRDFT
eukprot:764065-Hanusia_phi.AAC.2